MQPSDYLEVAFKLSVNDEMKRLIDTQASITHFEKGTTVLSVGDYSYSSYFILSGIVRGYYLDEYGKDVTKCFSAESEFFSTEGFRSNSPSTFTIECLETCTCVVLPYSLLNELLKQDEQIGGLVRELFQDEVTKQELKNKRLLLQDVKTRYTAFCQEHPNLLSRIPQKYIASYLGAAPQSLSRIKKKIVN